MWKWSTAAIAALFTSVVVQSAISKFIVKLTPFSIGQQVLGFALAMLFLTLYRLAIEKAAQQSVQRMGGDAGENRTGSDPAHR